MIGPLVGADDVCDAVTATLTAWLPSVLAELQAVKPIKPPLDLPASTEMPTPEALRANGGIPLPAFVVSSPGVDDVPDRHGDGTYDAVWVVVVTFFTHGASYDDTARRARLYATAGRTAIAQHQDLGGFASSAQWREEDYAPIGDADSRTLGAAFVTFAVAVDAVLNDRRGPTDPPDGLTDLPPVQSRTVTVERLP